MPRKGNSKQSFEATVMPFSSTQPSQTSKLLSLPAEIRLMIWTLVLTHKKGISIRAQPRAEKSALMNRTQNPGALLLVCRLSYKEGKSIFVSKNTFRISNNTRHTLGEPNIHGLRRLAARKGKASNSYFHHATSIAVDIVLDSASSRIPSYFEATTKKFQRGLKSIEHLNYLLKIVRSHFPAVKTIECTIQYDDYSPSTTDLAPVWTSSNEVAINNALVALMGSNLDRLTKVSFRGGGLAIGTLEAAEARSSKLFKVSDLTISNPWAILTFPSVRTDGK